VLLTAASASASNVSDYQDGYKIGFQIGYKVGHKAGNQDCLEYGQEGVLKRTLGLKSKTTGQKATKRASK
jgi:hypothetical protein